MNTPSPRCEHADVDVWILAYQRNHELDTELVRRAQHGDADAVGQLYRLHIGRMHRVALRQGVHDNDARDVAHDAWVKFYSAHLKPGTARQIKSSVSGLLAAITINVARSRHRTRIRRPGDDPLNALPIDTHEVPVDESDAQNASIDTLAFLRWAIPRLTEEQQRLLFFNVVEGLSTDDAVAQSGLGPSQYKRRLARARNALRHFRDEYFGPNDDDRSPPNHGGRSGSAPPPPTHTNSAMTSHDRKALLDAMWAYHFDPVELTDEDKASHDAFIVRFLAETAKDRALLPADADPTPETILTRWPELLAAALERWGAGAVEHLGRLQGLVTWPLQPATTGGFSAGPEVGRFHLPVASRPLGGALRRVQIEVHERHGRLVVGCQVLDEDRPHLTVEVRGRLTLRRAVDHEVLWSDVVTLQLDLASEEGAWQPVGKVLREHGLALGPHVEVGWDFL